MKADINVDDLRTVLNKMTEPARRHRCDICKFIFECHLCSIEEDHVLHRPMTGSGVFCEDCIHRHSLFVAITCDPKDMNDHKYRRTTGPWLTLGEYWGFYDSITGELLGRGCLRKTGYAWGGRQCGIAMGRSMDKEPA